MEEELTLENILDESQISDLFGDDEENQEQNEENNEGSGASEDKKKEDDIAEVDPDDLFGEPESVGNKDKDSKDKEGTDTAKSVSPPNNNFYSSIANALVEEGIFQNLDEESLNKVSSAEDFRDIFDSEIRSRLDDRYKRIDAAMRAGLTPTHIQRMETTVNELAGVTDERINDEHEEGENLRKNLIFQDYVNKGFSAERAKKEVDRSFKAGTDLEDAKEALQDLRKFYNEEYDRIVKEGNAARDKAAAESREKVERLKKAILEEDKAFGDVQLDKLTRRKVYDNLFVPNQVSSDTNEKMSAFYKYQREHSEEFVKNVGLLFTLTDGFKNIDKLVQGKVRKEVKKGLRDLEKTISHTSRNTDGSLNFMSGIKDPESKIVNWDLNL